MVVAARWWGEKTQTAHGDLDVWVGIERKVRILRACFVFTESVLKPDWLLARWRVLSDLFCPQLLTYSIPLFFLIRWPYCCWLHLRRCCLHAEWGGGNADWQGRRKHKVNSIYFTMFYYLFISLISPLPLATNSAVSRRLWFRRTCFALDVRNRRGILWQGGGSKVNSCHHLLVCMCCYFIDINLMPPPQPPPCHHKLMETVGWGGWVIVDWGYSGGIIWMG